MSDLPDGLPQDDEDVAGWTTEDGDSARGKFMVPAPQDPPDLSPGAIAFYLPGRAQPVVFKNQSVIVVGRYSPETPDVLLDLTSDHGVLLGVSRRHAVIEWTGTQYVVHDLGSTNGTFVNERKILPDEACPINSGDQMRLGQLLSIVYISAQEVSELMIYLMPALREGQPAVGQRLTPLFLLQVGQFLQTLQELHAIVMEAMGEKGDGFVIQQLKMDDAGRSVEITLTSITPSLQQLTGFIAQMKLPRGGGPDVAGMATLPERPSKPPTESKVAPSSQHRVYVQLAHRLLVDMHVLFEPEDGEAPFERMGALLQRLLESQLRLSPVQPL